MGKLPFGIFGPMYGKTGPGTGRNQNGKNVLSALPRLKENAAESNAQADAKNRLKALNNFLTDVSGMVDLGYQRYRKNCSPRNAAASENYHHAFLTSESGELIVNYPAMLLSKGSMAGPFAPTIDKDGVNLQIKWYALDESKYCRSDDVLHITVYDETDLNGSLWLKGAARRGELSTQVTLNQAYIGHVLHVYLAFCSADGKQTGNSFYAGKITM